MLHPTKIIEGESILTMPVASIRHCYTNVVGKQYFEQVKGEVLIDGKRYAPPICRPFEIVADCDEAQALCEAIDKDTPINDWHIAYQSEGTSIRVYWYPGGNRWVVSTAGKLDAYKSFWGSSYSFGMIWANFVRHVYGTVDTLFEQLDKQYVYYFFAETTDHNRIAIRHDVARGEFRLIYVGRTRVGVESGPFLFATDESILGDLRRQAQGPADLDWKCKFALAPVSLLLTHRQSGTCVKIWNREYYENMQLRGNDPFLARRYLYLVWHEPQKLAAFEKLYNIELADLRRKEHCFRRLCARVAYLISMDELTDEFAALVAKSRAIQDSPDLKQVAAHMLCSVNWNKVERALGAN